MSQLDELREIIAGDSWQELSEIKQRIENIELRTRDVSEVLAPAITKGIRESNDLVNALKAPVSEGLKQAIRVEPDAYAEILYPAIAPSIRLAISQAISSLLISINQSMESATSVSSLRTRFKSMRTGIPYAELAIRQTLLFRVEHVYLIERDSGLLIAECAGNDESALDSDAVSAMFSAIQSFVQDSFSGGDGARLTDFKVGDYTVWITHGPKAMLSCVIFGDPPEALKTQLTDKLDKIRMDYAQQISSFTGDSSNFIGLEDDLRPLLQLRIKDEEDRASSKPKPNWIARFFMLLICAFLLTQAYHWFANKNKVASVQHYLQKVPGLFVNSVHFSDDKVVVEGLRDPDAKIPYDILTEYGINPQMIAFKTVPFLSLEPELELQRFEGQLQPPVTVKLSIAGNRVALAGYAPINWLLEHSNRLMQLSADNRVDLDQLMVSSESLDVYLQGRSRLNEALIKKSVDNKPWPEIDHNLLRQLLVK